MDDITSSAPKQVLRIVRQASLIHSQQGCRWDTYFYKVVIGGNVRVTREVVSYMEEKKMTDVLDWLWQRGPHEEVKHHRQLKSLKLLITRIFMSIWMMVISIILTPIFYIVHILSASYLNRQQKRISGSIQLPLAYAAFSQSKEMMQYFLSQGVDIEHVDKRGNNVFHYVFDLSSVSESALEIFRTLVTFVDDTKTLKKLLVVQRNSSGLTAVEYAAKFGCPTLLNHILKHPNLLQETPFMVNSEDVCFADGSANSSSAKDASVDDDNVDSSSTEATAKLELVDVSIYEAGSITQQSTLLNLLSDRDVSKMSEENLKIFDEKDVVGTWMGYKIKQMIPGTVLTYAFDIIITVCLLVFVSHTFLGEHSIALIKWRNQEDCRVQKNELHAIAENKSSIFKLESFHRISKENRDFLQLFHLESLVAKHPQKAKAFLNAAGKSEFLTQMQNDSNVNLKKSEIDDFFDEMLKLNISNDDFTEMYVFRHFPSVLQQYAKKIIVQSHIFDQASCLSGKSAKSFYSNFTIEDNGRIIKPDDRIPFAIFFHLGICHAKNFFLLINELQRVGPTFILQDLKESKIPHLSHEVFERTRESCDYKMVINAVEQKGCRAISTAALIRYYRELVITDTDLQILLRICTWMYIIIDVLERCLFIAISVTKQTTKWDMVITVLGTKLPGSYARKQFNMLSYICILMGKTILENSRVLDDKTEQYYFMINIATILFVTAVIIRFLMHVHSMRLMPGIGHFVITTFMMATNLLHFSTVFGMVLLIFSVLFHILIDDTKCPLQKSPGFVTLYDSFISTFKLAFGHGEFDPFFSTTPVQLTYFLYVVIVGLLLLNLIIAIMSSTATDIMAEPWKEALWKIEWLDEATSVEYSCIALQLVIRKFSNCGYLMHKRAGFVVKHLEGSAPQVFIEIFHCQGAK